MLNKSIVRFLAVLLIGNCIMLLQLNAQAPSNIFSNITVSSPNAASLGKYGDYPVSYNTGLPQVSIPFYTIKEGPLSLPISISYHASGLKVMESSSWIGAGWALNAGGAITRTVVGAPDDRGHLTNTIKGHFSDYGYNSYNFDPAAGGSGQGCSSYPEQNIAIVRDAPFISGERDGEPDLFFFNFGGYSGKFYFRDDRTPVLVPEADFKIEPITINTAENIIGFIITASDGTKYYFGKNQSVDGNIDAVETTYPYTAENGLTSGDVYSAWYLNKIVSADGLFSITLIYQSEQYSDYTVSLFPVADNDIDNKHCTLVKNYLDGVRLKQINFSNGTVKFGAGGVRTDLGQYTQKTISDIVNTNSKSLDTVTVTDNQNFCKNFILYHSYFVDNTTTLPYALTGGLSVTTDTKRLRLDSIQEKTCDNSLSVPPYKFIYTVPYDSFAPRRLSFGQDHWGYYNGKYFNAGLIPTYTLNTYTTFAGADRESKWPEMSYGSLNKIIYPTGGYTQFTFEPNDVWLTYPYTVDSLVRSASIGPFFGTMTDQPISLTTSANTYKFVLNFYQNSPGASIGTASITGQTVYANKITPRGELIFVPGAGAKTYQFHQVDMLGTTGDYAFAKLYEMVPKTFTGNKIIGGLRIKSITNNNGATNDSATYYNYISGSQSTGVLYSRPVYVRILRNEILRQVGYPSTPAPTLNGCLSGLPNGVGTGYKKSPSSLRVMETVQGNHIGYNTVEVTRTGNGKTKYQYYGSDVWDLNQNDVCTRNLNMGGCDVTIPNWPDAPLPFEFMRGELKYEAYYNQANNLLKDIFYYPLFVNSIATTPACIYKSGALTFYNLTTAKKTKMIVVANEYPLTGGTITNIDSVFYESPYHQQQTRKVSINSKGVKTELKSKYAFDFRVPNCEAISDCWQAYATAYSNALNSYNLATNTCSNSGSCNCKWSVFQSYRYNWSVARKNYVACRRSNFMDATNAFKTAHDNARTGADTELRPILILQDKFINAPIETTTWKNGNLIAASYIKYDSTIAPNPLGNAYPSKQQEIKLAAPSATFTQAVSNNTTISKDTRYKDEATIKFAGGNVSELLKKDGITYSFIWDYTKNFTTAIATAAASAEIAYTSFESNGTGSFTYTTYKTADITAPTGNYCYPIASGSIQKTNLISTKSYILSYWRKTGTSLGITAGTLSNIITGYTRNGWTYIQLQFTGTASAIISGTGFIDEVRIYPVGSQLNTYTYTPLVGLTSQTDPNGKTSYFDYDKLGRLKNIKDKLKNITKTFFYNYGLTPTSPPALVGLNASNAASISCSINLTSVTTGQIFNFFKPYGSTTIIGNVPPDVYNINVSLGIQRYIQICSYGSYTSNFTAYNVQVDGLTCNSITIY